MNFWEKLKKPIFVLAPLADVTDAAFRRIIAKYGKPDVMWTEFVSADGLALAPEEGRKKLLKDLEYSESERPIVSQFFTSSPANMRLSAQLAAELGFDGIDINMGCPDKSIEKQGAGAAMIKNPENALRVIEAARQASLPVSVKTRLGFNTIDFDWIKMLLSTHLPALTIHLRTRKEMSKVSAHWELAKEIVELRNSISPDTLIIFNGDVKDLEDAQHKAQDIGADGIMFGRAIFGNPFLFANKNVLSEVEGLKLRLKVLVEHTKLFAELLPHKSFAIMKKHFKAYVKDFDGAAELRAQLMESNNASEVSSIVDNYLSSI